MPKTLTIEVFRPGTFKSMQGDMLDFSAETLRACAATYDPALSQAPVVIGHPQIDAPAYGWATSFAFDDNSGRLTADLGELEPHFADAVAAKRYKRVSLSFFSPSAPANPKPGSWYPKHIGFLGAAAPAVPGLKPVSFGADQTGVVEFAYDQPSGLFRQMRDFFIAQYGLETADKVLPAWQIDAMEEAEEADDEGASASSFAASQLASAVAHVGAVGSNKATGQHDAAFAAREADLVRREAAAVAREQQARHAANVSFADSIISDGRMLPVQRDRLISALDAIDEAAPQVSFADGADQPAGAVIRALIKELPKVVPLGSSPPASPEHNTTTDFAAPEGVKVDSDGLALLSRAEVYQRQHKVSLNEALKAVQR